MGFREKGFIPSLKIWWENAPLFEGSRMYWFCKKLQYTKQQIKSWNKDHFKNIFTKQEKLQIILQNINDHIIQNGITKESFELQKFFWEIQRKSQ